MDFYFYKVGDKERGPVSLKTLNFLFDKGLLSPDTLIQRDGENEWIPASQIPELRVKVNNTPQHLPVVEDRVFDNVEKNNVGISPWLRLFARKYDAFLFFTFFIFFLGIVRFDFRYMEEQSIFFDLLILFLWVFVESFFLSMWGTTPGKWFFNLRVADFTGKRLSFSQALTRSFLVWLKGIALGLPYLSIAAIAWSGHRLKKYGITDWDYKVGSVVLKEEFKIWKMILAIVTVILSFVVIGVVGILSKKGV